jgi:hypothetical protein
MISTTGYIILLKKLSEDLKYLLLFSIFFGLRGHNNIMGRILIYCGIALVVIGLLWPWLKQIPWGRFPGDIAIERENFRFFFPLVSCIVVSLVVSIILYLFKK